MITRVEALNYRCLRYVNQPLGDFHVLVGANATGKSAFLDVLQLLRDFVTYDVNEAVLVRDEWPSHGRARRLEELVFKQSADRFELALEFARPDDAEAAEVLGSDGFARYEVSIGVRAGVGLSILSEVLWRCTASHSDLMPQPRSLFPYEPDAPSTILRPTRQPGWRAIVRKTETGNASFNSEVGGWNHSFGMGAGRAALAYLPEDRSQFPVANWVKDVLTSGVHVIALNSAAMRRPVSPSAPTTFLPDGANVPVVIGALKEKQESRYGEWLEHVRTVLTDIADIEVKENPQDRHLYLAVRYGAGGEPVPSWLLSDGTLRFLALTLLAYLPEHRGVYLIEEPENGIHPRAVDAVYQSLSSVYDGQVLLATHSPLLVGQAADHPECILCFARNESGASDITTGRDHPRLRDWRGQVDLGTLYASGVLD